MKKETLLVAVCNQKGGVGKSVLTTLISSYLYFYMDKSVAIIDCDYPQFSIFNMREDDREKVASNTELQVALARQFEVYDKKAYPVIKCLPEGAINEAEKIISSGIEPDIIFFDFPGTVNNPGILNLLLNMQYIFIPVIADRRTLQSSLAFMLTLKECMVNLHAGILLKEVHLFWNRVDKRENTELYEEFNRLLSDYRMPRLKTELMDRKVFNKELSDQRINVFRSTLFPPHKGMLRNSNFEEFVAEFLETIKLQ